jgi:hypothetical protein
MSKDWIPPQGQDRTFGIYPPQGVKGKGPIELPAPPPPPPPPPWNGEGLEGWGRRKSHVITGSTVGSQTNYQVRVKVHKGAGSDSGEDVYCGGNCRDDFGDIRFTKSDKKTLLDYWMQEYVSGDVAVFWVEIDSIPASPSTVTIYVYYDAPSETTTSAGANTWVFFDDFLGAAIDTAKWDLMNGNWPTVSGGEATFAGAATQTKIRTDTLPINWTSTKGNRVMFRMKVNTALALYEANVAIGNSAYDRYLRIAGTSSSGNKVMCGSIGASGSYQDNYTIGGSILSYRWYQLIRKQNSSPYGVCKDGDTALYTQSNSGYFITDNDCYVWIWGDNQVGQDWIIDWVAVGIFVDPEPSHTSWGSEEED